MLPIADTGAIETKVREVACPGCGERRTVNRMVGFPICKACDDEWGPFPDIGERLVIMRGHKPFQQIMDERGSRRKVDVDRLHIPACFLDAQPTSDVRTWARSGAPLLVISGPVGVGKSYSACAALRSILEAQEGHGYMVNCAGLARMNDQTFKLYAGCTALALDDLGARITPAALSNAYEIIESRYGNRKPLIVTTNLPPVNLMEMDERIGSRLMHGNLVQMTGQDRRLA